MKVEVEEMNTPNNLELENLQGASDQAEEDWQIVIEHMEGIAEELEREIYPAQKVEVIERTVFKSGIPERLVYIFVRPGTARLELPFPSKRIVEFSGADTKPKAIYYRKNNDLELKIVKKGLNLLGELLEKVIELDY